MSVARNNRKNQINALVRAKNTSVDDLQFPLILIKAFAEPPLSTKARQILEHLMPPTDEDFKRAAELREQWATRRKSQKNPTILMQVLP